MSGQRYWPAGAMCLLATMASASEPAFQFTRAIELPVLEQEELFSVKLDAQVFDSTQADGEDLRLIDEAGQSVPFLVRQVKTTRTETIRQTWTVDEMSARPLEDGGLEITVTLDRDHPDPTGVKLVTPLENFEKRIRVETSDDGRQWEEVAQSPIFDYSRYVDVRRDSVPFPQTSRRHVRIIIDNVTALQESELLELTRRLEGNDELSREERVTIRRRPFRVDQVQFWHDTSREVPESLVKEAYAVGGFQIEQDPADKETHILVSTRQEPLTALAIETPERNFSRRAVVEVEDVTGVQRRWRRIGEAALTRLDFKEFEREELSIHFPETRSRRYRIVIENRDSPPLDITGVATQGNVYEVVFLANPEKSFQLAYGNADAGPAEHDTRALRELIQAGYVPQPAKLGEQQARDPDKGGFNWPAVWNNRAAMVAVIALLVLILGIVLYRTSRRLDGTPTEERGSTSPE